MKKTIGNLFCAAVLWVAVSLQTHAQGFVYDQQSATGPNSPAPNDFFNIQADSPLLQSFIPALSAIGFVQFEFWDIANNGTNGATVYVNLWTGSPDVNSATLLASTTPVYMPNGFVNNGLGFAGITNFNFSTPIALNSGQTYYIQPVVLSGDNPWTIGVFTSNPYPNGDLFSKGTDVGIDSWFREGVVSVPEPPTLALVGFGGLLAFGFKRRFKLFVSLLFSVSILSVHAADSVVQATADEAGLTPVSADSVPAMGTFWVMTVGADGNLIGSPYPFLPSNLSTPPIYSAGDNKYIVDETGGQLSSSPGRRMSAAQASAAVQSQVQSMVDLIGLLETSDDSSNESFQSSFTPLVYGSNDLWLSIDSVSNGISHLTIHAPLSIDINNTNFDLFYTTNLTTPFSNWWWILTTDIGQTNLIVPNATDANGFYALGLANTNGRPVAFGDFPPPFCPNTTNSIILEPSYYPSYTILTHPTNGVLSGTAPNLFYTPNHCFEGGQDSFTYKANDGTNDSAPVTVTITVYAYSLAPYSPTEQVCRGQSATFSLGSDATPCGETLSYGLLSFPAHGSVSGTAANLTYTSTATNFTGYDSFNYILYSACGGDSATGTVTVTVGDVSLQPILQTVITGTNRAVSITLSGVDYGDTCNSDTNYYTYTVTSSPAHGALSNTPPHLIYTPNPNYEGVDSFQFTASDGVWTSSPGSITIDITAGPILFRDCNPFDSAVKLAWMLDTNEQTMFPDPASQISDFIIYRSAHADGPYTAIATNVYTGDTSWMTYADTNFVTGQTNYYVVTFQAPDSPSGIIVESPFSNEIKASAQTVTPLIPANAIWRVVTNLDNPSSVTNLQAPFSNAYTNQYPNLLPLPNTLWPAGATWSNHITMFIPSNSVPLAQVTYSIAIDNNYDLYLNNSNAPIESVNHEGFATWSPFKSFEDVAPGLLHYGTNDIGVVIVDEGAINFFSMIVSTNACGQ